MYGVSSDIDRPCIMAHLFNCRGRWFECTPFENKSGGLVVSSSPVKVGQKVRISFEGTVTSVGSQVGSVMVMTSKTGHTHYISRKSAPDYDIEVIQPELTSGQVWKVSSGTLFFYVEMRDGIPGEFQTSNWEEDRSLSQIRFFEVHPEAELVFDPGTV